MPSIPGARKLYVFGARVYKYTEIGKVPGVQSGTADSPPSLKGWQVIKRKVLMVGNFDRCYLAQSPLFLTGWEHSPIIKKKGQLIIR